MSSVIQIEEDGRRVDLTIDRPPLNILDLATLRELDERLTELEHSETLQVLIIRGAGTKAFSAGVAIEDHTPDKAEEMLLTFHRSLRRLLRFPAATVAAVRGHCLGGGMELAACCDLRVAADDSRFAQPEIDVGCYPPMAAALYPPLIGLSRTYDLILTGRTWSAAEASSAGFVDRTAPAGDFEACVRELAEVLGSRSAAVQRLAKRAIRESLGRPLELGLSKAEDIYVNELAATNDIMEGMSAFLEKRAPEWRHE